MMFHNVFYYIDGRRIVGYKRLNSMTILMDATVASYSEIAHTFPTIEKITIEDENDVEWFMMRLQENPQDVDLREWRKKRATVSPEKEG